MGTKATNGKEMGWKKKKASTIYPSGVAYKNPCLDTKLLSILTTGVSWEKINDYYESLHVTKMGLS